MKTYKTPTSKKMFQASKRVVPRGVHSNVRNMPHPYPIYFEKGKGARIWDVDGNEYVDFLMAYGPLILGHRHPAVINAIKDQLNRGTMFGTGSRAELALSQKLVELIPCAEQVVLNCSGSEAVQTAIRLARAATGKDLIIKFEGNYHGWYDPQYISYLPPDPSKIGPYESPRSLVGSAGQPKSNTKNVIALPWNDAKLVEKALKKHRGKVAGVLMEAIAGNCVGLMPKPGYLQAVRRLTKKYKTLLIFDEIITGFKVALGGAQELLKVKPDICTFAKAVGGGTPISGVASTRRIMKVIDTKKMMHCGTYNSNPLVCAAALGALTWLQKNRKTAYPRMTRLGKKLMNGMKKQADKLGIPVQVNGPGPVFQILFTEQKNKKVHDWRSSRGDENPYENFVTHCLARGLVTMPAQKGVWHLSASHTDQDINKALKITEEAFKALKTQKLVKYR